MRIAQKAAELITAYCKVVWPDSGADMASTASEHFAHLFDGARYMSHKHIEQLDEINARLGARDGAGVYGRWMFSDGTSLLLTCEGPVATIGSDGLERWS